MGRIRSIRPEFPHSESIGRLSRDARLLFILTWGIADDSGRLRGNSRMLASLLFPYDDDAVKLLPGWLKELEDESMIRRYEVDGQSYIDIPKFLIHQKIDKPSPSKIPEFVEDSSNTSGSLAKNCLGREGKGEERRGEEKNLVGSAVAQPTSAPQEPPLAVFPCKGTGKKEWPLYRAKVAEWKQAYPGVDVPMELRQAKQWLMDNPTRGKTHNGMAAFLGRWLSKAQNHTGGQANGTRDKGEQRTSDLKQKLRNVAANLEAAD